MGCADMALWFCFLFCYGFVLFVRIKNQVNVLNQEDTSDLVD